LTLVAPQVPQIRYATPERLLERLTDLRFLSIDFLNTFLLTYRVFTDGVTVLDALKKVFYASSTVEPAQHDNARCSIRFAVSSNFSFFKPKRCRRKKQKKKGNGQIKKGVE
jgi:hypothetical protein